MNSKIYYFSGTGNSLVVSNILKETLNGSKEVIPLAIHRKENNIDIEVLKDIYNDFVDYEVSYENQADFISNILRSQPMIHSVKSRIKDPDRLIEKIIRKIEDRKLK